MRTSIILFACLFALTSLFAQNPAIVWQNTIGGSHSDQVKDISPTSDGGYIMGGASLSNISGDKTQDSNGEWDLWIVKINETGALEWEKTIGSSGSDMVKSIFQTDDGGYFVTADSNSDISGDKTENSKGGDDYWILKLDAAGNIEWQHTYGGNDSDYGAIAHQTSEGGFIVAGTSKSGISGDKTEPSYGDYDIWILKLDVDGSIVWQKTIGASGIDELNSFALANDGGYIINAASDSPASGDKSEDSMGSDDYWVIKLNAEGNVEWDKTLGGTGIDNAVNAIPTMDGGYLIGGFSNSPASGHKSENLVGVFDYWLVKLDSNGAILWDKTIGGDGIDILMDLKEFDDGSFLVSGGSRSGVYGDKTDPSQGSDDNWFVKVSSSGAITGQQTIGGELFDFPESIVLTPDGGFVVAAISDSNISGDKTQNSKGGYDYWVYKMAPLVLSVTGKELKTSISLYPNPSSGDFTIDLGKEYTGVTIEISNILGQVISSVAYASAKTVKQEINTPPGIYFVKVSTVSAGSSTLRMIKQ